MTDSGRKNKEMKVCVDNEGKKACVENEGSRVGGDGNESKEKNSADASSSSVLPCIDKLRDELSCAVRALWFFGLISIWFHILFRYEYDVLFSYFRFVWRYALSQVPLLVVTGKYQIKSQTPHQTEFLIWIIEIVLEISFMVPDLIFNIPTPRFMI